MKALNRTVVALTAGCLALTLAACGGGSSGTTGSSAAGNGNLEVFSWWTSGSESAALKALFDAYTTANSGAKIVNGAVAGGGGGNAQAVLQTRLQGGNPPDVWQTHPGAAISEYITSSLVADVSSVYTDNKLSDVVPKAMYDAISKDGKQYGVSVGAHRGNVLWYSTKALAKANVTVPDKGYTPDAFLADLAKLKAAGVTPLCLGAKDTFATAELFENTLLGNGGATAWNSLTGEGGKWDSDQVKTAASQFGKMLEYADPDASALSWDQATKKLASGDCAFESMGDWAYGELVKNGAKEGTDFGYTAHPGNEGAFMAVVDTLVVAQNAKNKDAAMKFMANIMTKEAQLAFNKEKGSTPLRTDVDVSSLPKYQQGAAESFKSDQIVQSIVHGEAMNPQFSQALNDAVTQFAQSKDVNAFAQSLATAATS
jgi:glucose/mannose transport system substrate-binding protein